MGPVTRRLLALVESSGLLAAGSGGGGERVVVGGGGAAGSVGPLRELQAPDGEADLGQAAPKFVRALMEPAERGRRAGGPSVPPPQVHAR